MFNIKICKMYLLHRHHKQENRTTFDKYYFNVDSELIENN